MLQVCRVFKTTPQRATHAGNGCGWTHDAEQNTITQCHDSGSAQRSVRAKEHSAFIRTRTVFKLPDLVLRQCCALCARPALDPDNKVRYANALSSIKVRKKTREYQDVPCGYIRKPARTHTNGGSIGSTPWLYHRTAGFHCGTPAVPAMDCHRVSPRDALATATICHGARVVGFSSPQMAPQILPAGKGDQVSLILRARLAHELCGRLDSSHA
jgi:hypothetical protein